MVRPPRSNEVLPAPSTPTYTLAHIGFSYGDRALNKDKDFGRAHRYDSIPIVNGIIRAGAACSRFQYDPTDPERMERELSKFDGYIVRINPGQLSNPGVVDGAQQVFDNLMEKFRVQNKPVWSSPLVQKTMGAKDALVKIKHLSCGLPDTNCYYDATSFEEGFRRTAAYQPRVLKRNRGSAGEGVWLVWLVSRPYCDRLGDRTLEDDDVLELMEMCDNHVERHTVKEFMSFCVGGAESEGAGKWETNHPGGFFKCNSADASDSSSKNKNTTQVHVVDQRLLPRIREGEVRLLLVRDQLHQIIHKKPVEGGMSAVGTLIESPTFYEPDCAEYCDLRTKFIEEDLPKLKDALGVDNQPLPLIWTADFIPMDDENEGEGELDEKYESDLQNKPSKDERKSKKTRWVVGEFNCSCVGLSAFLAAANGGRLDDVSDVDYARGMRLCDVMGEHVVKALDERKKETGKDAS